ncbi:MAG: hypothetical protein ABF461_01910 [Zymomonas mobilis subsp. pomaceae]|uniref:hypothetical protein n=1 Tax=Zymomonas mobilis TaxID=542 RepID=UPI0039EA24B8
MPARPAILIIGQIYMTWLSFSLAMIVCAATHENATLERLLHPLIYFAMPISNIFIMMEWIPNPYREWIDWVPMAQCAEIVRYGQFESASNKYFSYGYMNLVCMTLTLIGLLYLRLIRRHVVLN